MKAADIEPIERSAQTQPLFDLFLIFIGANVVATTFQVGSSLAGSFSLRAAFAMIAAGSLMGAAFVAVLAPLGPRLRVPSVIAARPALGIKGAGLVAAVLYISNFAWIALNNVIAASACVKAVGFGSETTWSIVLGLVATTVVWKGPHAVAVADRVAVPLMLGVGVLLTVACLRAPAAAHIAAACSASLVAWPRRGGRLPSVVDSHVRGLFTVFEISARIRMGSIRRSRRDEPVADAVGRDGGNGGRLE